MISLSKPTPVVANKEPLRFAPRLKQSPFLDDTTYHLVTIPIRIKHILKFKVICGTMQYPIGAKASSNISNTRYKWKSLLLVVFHQFWWFTLSNILLVCAVLPRTGLAPRGSSGFPTEDDLPFNVIIRRLLCHIYIRLCINCIFLIQA